MDDLIRYVIECRKRGFNDDYIKDSLKRAGHQDFIIEEALLKSGVPKNQKIESNKKSFPTKTVSLLAIMLIAISLPLLFLSSGDDSVTGHSVKYSLSTPTKEEVKQQLQQKPVSEVKDEMINEQIKTIENLNISLKKKEQLIDKQTERINSLINKLEYRREKTVNASLELINSILSR